MGGEGGACCVFVPSKANYVDVNLYIEFHIICVLLFFYYNENMLHLHDMSCLHNCKIWPLKPYCAHHVLVEKIFGFKILRKAGIAYFRTCRGPETAEEVDFIRKYGMQYFLCRDWPG